MRHSCTDCCRRSRRRSCRQSICSVRCTDLHAMRSRTGTTRNIPVPPHESGDVQLLLSLHCVSHVIMHPKQTHARACTHQCAYRRDLIDRTRRIGAVTAHSIVTSHTSHATRLRTNTRARRSSSCVTACSAQQSACVTRSTSRMPMRRCIPMRWQAAQRDPPRYTAADTACPTLRTRHADTARSCPCTPRRRHTSRSRLVKVAVLAGKSFHSERRTSQDVTVCTQTHTER
jgi:hypothetical protein